MGRGLLNPQAVGQMARATIHTLRKAYKGKKSGEPSGGRLGYVKSTARKTGAAKRARADLARRIRAEKRDPKLRQEMRDWKRSQRRKKKANRLTKGTAAAKRHMAKLRRMRKKKR